MLINIKSMSAGDSAPVIFTETFTVPAAYGLLAADVTAAFDGRLTNRIDRFELTGGLCAELDLSCSCCLETVRYTLEADVSEVFRQSELDGEFFSFTGDDIDVCPAVEMNLLLNIPYKVVCAEDCKGLCPLCGANLNAGDCGCDRTPRDPRFEVLRSVFPPSE